MSKTFPTDAAAAITHAIEEEHGYLSWLGTEVESIERGRIVLAIPYDEKLTNTTSPPTVHGGVAATLVDTAGGLAQRTTFDDPTVGGVATVNLNVNYLRRAGGDLTATAEVVRAGGSIGVSEMRVESPTPDGDTEPVVVGQGSFRLFRDGDRR
ncbi:PaaI family thioesterase [Haloferacaceae archaeon DSL9]